VIISLAIPFASGASPNFQGEKMGPLNVTAPFIVVDNKGQRLFAVTANPSGGGGNAILFNAAGQLAAEFIATADGNGQIKVNKGGATRISLGISATGDAGNIVVSSDTTKAQTILHGDRGIQIGNADGQLAVEVLPTQDGNGQIKINRGGATRIQLGISKVGDAGNIVLSSNTTKAQTILHGDVGVRQTNAQGNPVFQAGADDNNNGYAMVANGGGTFLSKISVATDGSSGRVEVSAGGEVKALMGIKLNGKGDVCANGEKGTLCLSTINPTY